ncbi:MAG: sigma-70 family RNA polymerase sigma factor [Deltaproteobacteria bacterium]|nr:sigma-70 family RNA polymerase sigma factor [Deltaproteobacteria bacterium]
MAECPADARPSGEVVALDRSLQDLGAITAGAARGDPGSILLLYDRFGPVVNRLVWRLLGADGEHKDIVHDVFVTVLESIGTVETPSVLERWICSVTVNTVRNQLRKRKFYRLFHVADDPDDRCTVPAGPDAHLALRRFFEALDGMSADDRIVFVLKFVEGRRLPEIGEICGCSFATVKRRLRRARAEFFRQAGDEPFFARIGKRSDDD